MEENDVEFLVFTTYDWIRGVYIIFFSFTNWDKLHVSTIECCLYRVLTITACKNECEREKAHQK